MFNHDGSIRPFGVGAGENKTVFSFGVYVLVLAIMSFYLFSIIDMVFHH
jgi:hypothetical protein